MWLNRSGNDPIGPNRAIRLLIFCSTSRAMRACVTVKIEAVDGSTVQIGGKAWTRKRQQLDEATRIAEAAQACADAGSTKQGIAIALDVEQLVYEVKAAKRCISDQSDFEGLIVSTLPPLNPASAGSLRGAAVVMAPDAVATDEESPMPKKKSGAKTKGSADKPQRKAPRPKKPRPQAHAQIPSRRMCLRC
jgi:hypothetical protein